MSGQFLLDWSALAISLFTALLLLWLGLTVLVNAERRSWGVSLATGGLLVGAAFFLSHSVVVSQGASALIRDFGFWWHVGWAPVIAAPYAWYLLMLWYSGYWDDPRSRLHRRQSVWLWLSILYTLFLAGLLLTANPLPSLARDASVDVGRLPSLGGFPLITLAYPPYILMCIALALDALLHPAPSGRVLGDLARRRARPWLVSASLLLLLVSLLVGAAILWLLQSARQIPTIAGIINDLSRPLAILDLTLAAVLMAAVLLMGQAIVSYEIFTGKTLPRRGFLNLWRNTVLLAGAFCLIAATGMTLGAQQIFTIVTLLALVAFAFVLFGWQSFRERERSILQLRPLVTSQRLYESILTSKPPVSSEPDLAAPFGALCQEVLGARQAMLIPLGSLAALGGSVLHYPAKSEYIVPELAGLLGSFTSPHSAGTPLDPDQFGGAIWAAPLWSERGLVGVLLLGPKSDGGFYSQEEIEIARSSGERLADIQASTEMARRLMALQRQRLAETQVLDQQTRRFLHDDLLPQIHAAMLALSSGRASGDEATHQTIATLADLHRQVSDILHELPRAAAPEVSRLGLAGALQQVVEVELIDAFDEVSWKVSPEAGQRLEALPPLESEVLFYAAREALRNAARHGRRQIDPSPLHLLVQAECHQAVLELTVEDDGVGMNATGHSTGGSGEGLSLHSTMMAVIGGSLEIESRPGKYTRVVLRLPE